MAWNGAAADVAFELQRSVNGSAFATLVSATSSTSFTDTVAAFNVEHCHRVRAVQYGMLVGPHSDGDDGVVSTPLPGRTGDHEEGAIDGRCACGSTAGSPRRRRRLSRRSPRSSSSSWRRSKVRRPGEISACLESLRGMLQAGREEIRK